MITPLLAVDSVITFRNGIVLIKRSNPPFQGYHALPGGFVEIGEKVEDAAQREAKEETGLEIEICNLIGIYSDPARDPRGHVVSAAFLAKGKGLLQSGSDAISVEVFNLDNLPPLAFDHDKIIRDAFRGSKMISETIN